MLVISQEPPLLPEKKGEGINKMNIAVCGDVQGRPNAARAGDGVNGHVLTVKLFCPLIFVYPSTIDMQMRLNNGW